MKRSIARNELPSGNRTWNTPANRTSKPTTSAIVKAADLPHPAPNRRIRGAQNNNVALANPNGPNSHT